MKIISAGIAGAAGYTGGELIRILLNHPYVILNSLLSRSSAGKRIDSVHMDLVGVTDMCFTDKLYGRHDVLFLCMGHGQSRRFLEDNDISESTKIIDLSNDFRLSATSTFGSRKFIYGLPEMNAVDIIRARNVANPGCFATAIQLGLLPLANSQLIREVYTTGITGSTGAGQSLTETSHFSWRANNIQAYKTHTHQHIGEVMQSIQKLQLVPEKVAINFVPWRGDFTRGIFTTSQMKCSLPLEEIITIHNEYYNDAPFVRLATEPIFLKQVVNTNKCLIHYERVADHLIIHTALDNLIKGASGQAVQNMNFMFDYDDDEGLKLKAGYF